MKISLVPAQPAEKEISLVSFSNQQQTIFQTSPTGQKHLILGIGEKDRITRRKLISVARQAAALARAYRLSKIALSLDDFLFPNIGIASNEELAEILATNFEMANFEFVDYKTPPKEGWNFVDEIILYGNDRKEIQLGIARGQAIGEAVNATRRLSNTPGGEMTPAILAQEARKAAVGTKVKVTVLDKTEISQLNMGGVIGVSKGSSEEPKFIILEYKGGKAKEKPIVLVGKGVTFDTGGLNVKPGDFMYEMHMDMSGGAAVIYAVILAAKLQMKKNVVGLVPAVENMPSGSSYHPGDVLKSMSGKTIEVLNTDAEGRIILADALEYAKRYNPRLVVDVATLTGGALVALGQRASAIFTPDKNLQDLFCKLGEESGDYVWPLPLWEEYEEEIKGTFGDWANIGKSKFGQAIHGAIFLKQFAQGYPWIHIDMAPRMTAIEGEYLSKGAAGAPVRLLAKLLSSF